MTEKKRKNVENNFNGIGKAMARFLRVGCSRRVDERVVEAVTTSNTMIPPLSLYGR